MLKELEEQEDKILGDLRAVREAIGAEKERIARAMFGVFVGVVVLDRKGVEHKVTKVDAQLAGKPWLAGNPKKKDGTFGTANRNLYSDWAMPNSK